MQLGKLVTAIRSGMEQASDLEVQKWFDASEKQDQENHKYIYTQIAEKVHEAMDNAINAGIEKLLNDFDVNEGVFKITDRNSEREIDLAVDVSKNVAIVEKHNNAIEISQAESIEVEQDDDDGYAGNSMSDMSEELTIDTTTTRPRKNELTSGVQTRMGSKRIRRGKRA